MRWKVEMSFESKAVAMGIANATREFMDKRGIPFAYVRVEDMRVEAAKAARVSGSVAPGGNPASAREYWAPVARKSTPHSSGENPGEPGETEPSELRGVR